MARLGKQIPSYSHAPVTRRLANSSRPRISSTSGKQQRTYRRQGVRINQAVVEKILLALFIACVFLFTILLSR